MKSVIWPVLKREYITRITSRGFWISTALFPLLTLAVTVLPSRLAVGTKVSMDPVRVVDLTGNFYPVLGEAVKASPDAKQLPPLQLEKATAANVDSVKRKLNSLADAGAIQGYVVADEASIEKGSLIFFARNPSGALSNGTLSRTFAEAVRLYRLRKMGLTQPGVTAAIAGVEMDVQKATNDPKKSQSGVAAVYMSIALVMFIYFSLIFYGVYVLRGVLEEKSNRIVEIIVSAVKPFDLMMGKIIGIGCVGLSQIAIWLTFAAVFTAPQIAGLLMMGESRPSVSPMMLIFFPVYFVLGYFLFATIYAGIGSMFNSEEDAQQMVSIASMLLVVPMIMLAPVMKNPNGTFATVMSLIPFFSPILMYLRIAVQMPPTWQIALSVGLLLCTIVVMTWIAAKIYRVGILMYGKKPTIPELIKWLKYT